MPHFARPDGYFLPSNAAEPPTAKYLLPLQPKGLTFVSLGTKQGKTGARLKGSTEGEQEGVHSMRGSPLPSGPIKGTLMGVADAMGGAMRRYSNLQGICLSVYTAMLTSTRKIFSMDCPLDVGLPTSSSITTSR